MISSVKNLVHPSLRGVGNGIYHLVKGDITEAQCQRLTIGTIRLAGAVAALATIALAYYTEPETNVRMPQRAAAAILLVMPSTFLADLPTFTLGLAIGKGLPNAFTYLPNAVNCFARGFFLKGVENIIGGSIFFFSHLAHKEISNQYPTNYLKDKLIKKGESLGSDFYQWLKSHKLTVR